MKTKKFFLTSPLVIAVLVVLSPVCFSSIPLKVLSESKSLLNLPEFYYGNSFISQNEDTSLIYNLTTKNLTSFVSKCIWDLSSSLGIWCIEKNAEGYVTLDELEIPGGIVNQYPSQKKGSADNTMIVGDTAVGFGVDADYNFDLNTKSFSCEINYGNLNEGFPFFNGFNTYVFYLAGSGYTVISYINCNQAIMNMDYPIYPGGLSEFFNFNSNTLIGIKAFYGVGHPFNAFSTDLTGTLFIGPYYNFLDVAQLNDTHMIGIVKEDILKIRLYTINSTLGLNEVFALSSGISYDSKTQITINQIKGAKNYASFQIKTDETNFWFVYDFGNLQYVYASVDSLPFVFSNGTTLSFTPFGYFVQTAGSSCNFVPKIFSSLHYSSVNSNLYAINYNQGDAECLLHEFNSQTNTENTIQLNCSLSVSGAANIVEVGFFNNGSVEFIAYKDRLHNLYISTAYASYNDLTQIDINNYPNAKVFVNLTTNFGVWVGSDDNRIITVQFNTSTGSILNTNTQIGNQKNVISSIGRGYFGIASTNSSSKVNHHGEIQIWNANIMQSSQTINATIDNIDEGSLEFFESPNQLNFYQFGILGYSETYLIYDLTTGESTVLSKEKSDKNKAEVKKINATVFALATEDDNTIEMTFYEI